ncbi:40S ribosomal protein S15a-1 [Hymenolepis weldensis]
MVRCNVLADALKSINNAERRKKRQVMIRPCSKVIIRFLKVMQQKGYIGEFEQVDDHRSGKIIIQLNGRLNKCGVISPRFKMGVRDTENWTRNLLPSRQFGYLVLTTSAGMMDHEEARKKHVMVIERFNGPIVDGLVVIVHHDIRGGWNSLPYLTKFVGERVVGRKFPRCLSTV